MKANTINYIMDLLKLELKNAREQLKEEQKNGSKAELNDRLGKAIAAFSDFNNSDWHC